MRIILYVVGVSMLSAVASGQTFSRVVTQTRFETMEHVFAVADLNADGLDDIVVGSKIEHSPTHTVADRLKKVRLRIFTSDGDGTYTRARRLTSRQIRAHRAVVVVGDFNGDGRDDLAVYDEVAYVDSESSGYGNPPQLYLSRPNGRLQYSNSLEAAVRREHRRDPPEPPPGAIADLHLKMATTGDLEGDGDLDLWVESDGGNNMHSHFAINDGRATFTLDAGNRATDFVHHDWLPAWWRYHEALFMDVDHDGDSDVVLGRLSVLDRRDRRNNPSIILVNDGSGFFPERLELPHPRFSNGFTRVFGIARFDINQDGWDDIFMLHVRANDGRGGGRYIQALINTGDGSFVDETRTRVRRQRRTAIPSINLGGLAMHDVDLDGCQDLVVTAPWDRIRPQSPLAYRNNGSGQFSPMPARRFVPDPEEHFGWGAMPIDANGDGAIDFVVSERGPGRDGVWETDDDATWLVTLLNTTRARARPRCWAGGKRGAGIRGRPHPG